MSFLLFAVFSLLVKIFRSWYNQSKITTIHTEEISHDKTDQNPKKLLLFLAILYLFLGLFFTLAGCVSGNLLCFLLFVYHLLSRQYPSFCTAVPIGQKILYTEEGICIHVPFQRVYTVFWTEIECLMRVDLRDLSNSDSGKTLWHAHKTQSRHTTF